MSISLYFDFQHSTTVWLTIVWFKPALLMKWMIIMIRAVQYPPSDNEDSEFESDDNDADNYDDSSCRLSGVSPITSDDDVY